MGIVRVGLLAMGFLLNPFNRVIDKKYIGMRRETMKCLLANN
jgi:hypothetical protein